MIRILGLILIFLCPPVRLAELAPSGPAIPRTQIAQHLDMLRDPSQAEIIFFIRDEALREGVSGENALAVAWRESRLNPRPPDSKRGAKGLFQLMPHTIRILRVSDPYDYRQSTIAAIGLLANYQRFGGEKYAFCAFARGPGRCR
jgi:hypothetical protein